MLKREVLVLLGILVAAALAGNGLPASGGPSSDLPLQNGSVVAKGNPGTDAYRVLIYAAPTGSPLPTIAQALRDSSGGEFSAVDYLYGNNTAFPSVAGLIANGTKAILTFTDYTYLNNVATGDSLARFIEAGGGVVSAVFADYGGTGWEVAGRYKTQYDPIPHVGNSYASGTLGTVHVPGHAIMQGVTTVGCPNFKSGATSLRSTAYGTKIADWTGGQVECAVFDSAGRRACFLGFYPNYPSFPLSGHYIRQMVNALKWVANPIVHDVGVSIVKAPTGALDSGAVATPACSVYNYGNQTETYYVRMKIGTGYSSSAQVSSHAAGTYAYVTFQAWTASPRGSSAVSCSTELSGDATPSNDKRTGSVTVNVHDVGATAIKVPASPVDSGASRVPACSLYNFGTVAETYTARLKIGASYDNTVSVSGHAAGTYIYVTFPSWTASVRGSNAMSCSTELGIDQVTANDKVSGAVDVAVHDIAAVAIVAPSGAIGPGAVIPQATVNNYGTAREACDVTFAINGVPSYSRTVNLPAGLPLGVDTVIDFPSWTATTGSYAAKCTVALAGDQIVGNNLVSSPFSVGEVDVGVTAMLAPTGTNDTGDVLVPSARVKNFGEFAASFTTYFSFDSTGGVGPVYDQNITVTDLSALTETTLVFPEWAKPHPAATYATRCSIYLAGDGNPANDLLTGSFVIRAGGGGSGETGWVRLTDLLPGDKGKKVKDGGCLTYKPDSTGEYLYALKGNGRCEYYRYNTSDNSWTAKESIPAIGSSGKKKAVKKGAAIATASGKVYAAKGNSTVEWWQYDPALSGTPTYPWTQKLDIPAAAKLVKEGTGAVTVTVADTEYVYFLRGSGGTEFIRYNPETDLWTALTPAPTGTSGKAYKDGSCLATDGTTTVWALKGSYNEMAAYDVATNAWTAKTSLPLTGSSGKKKKVKSGAGIAWHNGTVYALKGGGTTEFWSYQCDSDRWVQKTDIPAGSGKPVKGGGALCYGDNPYPALYAFKGNNTLDFFKYGLPAYGLQLTANSQNEMSSGRQPSAVNRLLISPNPFSGTTTISYSLPTAANYSLKLYDVTGQLISTLASGNRNAGSYTLTTPTLARGIYVLKLATNNTTNTAKLIVE